MPTKHIPEKTWRKVEEATVKAVISTRRPIEATEMLNALILKGLETIKTEDYERLLKGGNPGNPG